MRVLIIDKHPIVMAGCQFLVGTSPEVELKAAFTAEAGFETFVDWLPDIVVLDLLMPGSPAVGYIGRLFAHEPSARIVVHGSSDDPLVAAHMIGLGARAFVSKTEDPACVLHAIREVSAGNFYMSPHLAQKVATLRVAPNAMISPKVSARERDILTMLATGKSMAEIAKTVNLSYKSISAICNRLRTRFDARTTIELVRIALLLGIC